MVLLGVDEIEEKRGPGRPSKYERRFCKQAKKLCALGATNRQLADFFEVQISTINLWLVTHKEFSDAVKMPKVLADARVERSLYQRAVGYDYEAIKFITVSDGKDAGSHIEEMRYIEHCPPDPTAMIFWLKNRKPKQWREKHEVEAKTDATVRVVGGLPDAEGE